MTIPIRVVCGTSRGLDELEVLTEIGRDNTCSEKISKTLEEAGCVVKEKIVS